MKDYFFDRQAVIDAIGKGAAKALSKAGAFVRRAARSSIRKRKKPSAPGQPPSSHTGLLKNFIFFAYDPKTRTVVVGPEKLNRGTGAPELLEFGGSTVTDRKTHIRVKGGKRPKYVTIPKGTRVTIRARPYMAPAAKAARKDLPAQFRDIIKVR